MAVKLPLPLEEGLRRRSAALGRPASELIREALQAYLAEPLPTMASAYALGEDLFGAHSGPVDLAENRQKWAADLWGEKHDRRATS